MLLKKAAVPFLLFGASFAVAQNVVHQTVHSDQVIPIQTALNHISMIMLAGEDCARSRRKRDDAD